ncbi:uncharacterized protein LOC129250844 [Anastrepha obliqua]|uniref:uncharacterized protein LOC129250844 n=1 Tax=Anastrepha obliqua TaxID=95512 RepID=UPI0024095FA2|nr:uncharacterized protein LOC129250844 [Anastrepha obliqua]
MVRICSMTSSSGVLPISTNDDFYRSFRYENKTFSPYLSISSDLISRFSTTASSMSVSSASRLANDDTSKSMPDSVASPAPSLSPISSDSPSCSSLSAAPSASFSFSPPSSPALNEASAPAAKTKNAKVSELNETIKSAMTENNKLTAELIDIEKKKVAAIELLTESVVSFLERN